MASTSARAAFLKYLQREEVASLLLFWEGVSFRMKKLEDVECDKLKDGASKTNDGASKAKEDKNRKIDKEFVTQIHHVGTELYQR